MGLEAKNYQSVSVSEVFVPTSSRLLIALFCRCPIRSGKPRGWSRWKWSWNDSKIYRRPSSRTLRTWGSAKKKCVIPTVFIPFRWSSSRNWKMEIDCFFGRFRIDQFPCSVLQRVGHVLFDRNGYVAGALLTSVFQSQEVDWIAVRWFRRIKRWETNETQCQFSPDSSIVLTFSKYNRNSIKNFILSTIRWKYLVKKYFKHFN